MSDGYTILEIAKMLNSDHWTVRTRNWKHGQIGTRQKDVFKDDTKKDLRKIKIITTKKNVLTSKKIFEASAVNINRKKRGWIIKILAKNMKTTKLSSFK